MGPQKVIKSDCMGPQKVIKSIIPNRNLKLTELHDKKSRIRLSRLTKLEKTGQLQITALSVQDRKRMVMWHHTKLVDCCTLTLMETRQVTGKQTVVDGK